MWDEEFSRRVRAAALQKKAAASEPGSASALNNGSNPRPKSSRPPGKTMRPSAGPGRPVTVAAPREPEPSRDAPRPSGSRRSPRIVSPSPRGKSVPSPKATQRSPRPQRHARLLSMDATDPTRGARRPSSRENSQEELPPVPAHIVAAALHARQGTGPRRRPPPMPSQPKGRHSSDGDDSSSGSSSNGRGFRDGYESPTLHVDADLATGGDAVGVVTRSMARRMKAQEPPPATTIALPISIPRMPSAADSVETAVTAATPLSRAVSAASLDDEPSVPPLPPAGPDDADPYGSPENHYRHVRRSPKFNYDRFIPARSPDPGLDMRRHEPSHRAGSPVYLRTAHQIEYQAQVEEANRTYDALLRSELLNDRSAADDFTPGRRLRSSSPPPARPTSRRDRFGLSSSPNQLPSLVPWSSGLGSSTSHPPTTPPGSPPRAAPVFTYRSPRKTSLNSPSSMPALGPANARSLFGRASPVHEVYQQSALAKDSQRILGPRQAPRRIAKDPVKVLDAPGIRDDYYLNLIDWSSSNQVAVALNSDVFVWDAESSQTSKLCDVAAERSNEWVTSVAWAENGKHLALGLNSGAVQTWDASRGQRVRTFAGHTRRVGVVQWNESVVSTGSRDKRIYNYDTRVREGAIASTYYGHTQEVCGLRWSPGGTQLASGGNDNMLLIWDTRFTPLDSRVASYHPDIAAGARAFRRPLFSLSEHTAAVKAIAWSPVQRGLLASGGGTDDRCIRLWDTQAGTQISAHDTRSQVCNLRWSHDGTELVSTHGYSENHVIVWKYPAMRVAHVLAGHTKRVLYLAHSPDGQTIATAAGDETIRFWEVFPKDSPASEPGALPSSVSRLVRPAGATPGAGLLLDDLAHVR